MNNESRKTRVCVTGADGFIGSNLMKLLSSNTEIDAIPFIGDLLIKEDVDKFFVSNKDIDQIVHLVGLFFGDFESLVKVNVVALSNLLESAVANNVNKIIFTSSGAVYGEPVDVESKENDPLNPSTLYGLAKKYAEECIYYYSQNFGTNYTILRFPNVYGEGNEKGVIYNFISNIKEKGEITIYGDGAQTRNFLHVSDACRAIEKVINYQESGIFNISNSKRVSINDIVKILQKKYTFKIRYLPANNNLIDLLLDARKAGQELKFDAKIRDIKLEI